MKKQITVDSLHGKIQNIMKLYEDLEKTPRKFGTDMPLTSSEIHLLELIGDNEGLSVTDIARIQGVTKGAISQNLKRLKAKGFTVSQPDSKNISRSLILLTNKGKIAYYAHKHWHETMDGGFQEYFHNLGREKIEIIEEFLGKIETFLKQRILTEK
jgi:DNA-binding MarR family transcriptional regulator